MILNKYEALFEMIIENQITYHYTMNFDAEFFLNFMFFNILIQKNLFLGTCSARAQTSIHLWV